MPEVLAILSPAGPGFVEIIGRAWDRGDAVLPLDLRAPRAHLDRVIAELAPTRIVESDGEPRHLPGGRPCDDGDALVVATSGTTGEPKGAVHTTASVEHSAFATSTAVGVAADNRWLACLPLSHVGGLSVVTRALVTGTALEVHQGFDPVRVDAAALNGATHVSLVPTALDRVDARRWRTILLGGSSIPTDRPPNTVATYGMTETMGGVVYDGLALNGVGMRVVEDIGDGPGRRPRIAANGTVGLIELRSPTLLRCYRDGTDPVRPDGWYPTGDLGSIDPVTERLTVHGRADDLIISGGEKVWPDPVERLIATDDRVRDVAVIGVPDPEWGQRVIAVVVPVDHADPPPLVELRELVRAQLPIAAAPKGLRLSDSLARTTLGKLRRRVIAASTPDLPRSG